MTETHTNVIERNAEKMHIWLNEISAELDTDDERYAYRALAAFLHTLRDRLPVDEAAQLAAQMPDLVRGVYYEGWRPAIVPERYRTVSEFLDRVAERALLHGETEASVVSVAAARVLRRHISQGELEDVFGMLPGEIRALIEESD